MASVLSGSEEKDNFQKLSRLLIDGGTQSLRTYFTSIHHPTPLAAFLNTHKKTLINLKSRRILRQEQFDRLFPVSGVPSANDYDITLLFLLLRHISGLSPPVSTSSWDVLPPPTDLTKEAHMARLKWYRNNVFAHIKSTEVPTVQFNQYWVEISDALISLGGVSQGDIDTLKVTPLERDYVTLLKEWVDKDLDLSKEVNETKKEVQETKKEVQETKIKVDETNEVVHKMDGKLSEMSLKAEKMAVDLASLKEEFSSKKVNSKKDITAAKGDEAASGKTSHDPGNESLPKKKAVQDFIDYLHLRYTTGEEVLIEPLEDMEDGNFTLENMFSELEIVRKDTDIKDHCERNREKDFSHGMTLRELYEDVAYSQIRRYFEKENINFDDDNIQAMSLRLGEIAFHSLKENANTFPLPKLSEVLKKVGFLTRLKSPSTIRAVEMYSFVHKSFQDFFCAVFIADRLGQGIVESVLINDFEFYHTVNRYDLAMMVGSNVMKAVESLAGKVPENPPEGIPWCDWLDHSLALKLLCQCLAKCKKSEIVKVLEKAYCLLPCRVLLQIDFEPCYSTLLGLSYLLSYDLSRSQSLQTVGNVSGLRPLGDLAIPFLNYTDGIPDQFTKALASSPIRKLGISCPPGAGDIVKALVSMLSRTTLQSLSLFDGIDEANFGNLIESLKNNVTLSEICIVSDDFGDSCAIKLAEILSDNTSLTDVRINSTILGGTGIKSLANALKVNKTVRTLGIDGGNLTSEAGRAIGEMLRHNTTVTSLFLSGRRLGDSGARGIAIGLAQNTTIAQLSIAHSSIGTAGIKAITKVIQNVTRLNLSGNPVGYGGVKAIARLLVKSCCRLKFLFLDHCNIDVFGAKKLAIALSRNSCLEKLSVACNDINDEGMCALAESVASNETLQVLYISYNNVGQNGKKVIISACETSKSVRHLYHENDSILNTFTKPHSVCVVPRRVNASVLILSLRECFISTKHIVEV
ncbi:uncharacterized protein LOC116608883 isoform X4 [Nematostella vectensis]|uniref:uncharacterized protein LOC116608883 isoform X4 n=1 Tax=Nematostella vectensis TaxID=45351 RepID=UPI00207735F1|nr:uncharacterized protein LOC116608883 isoform X4 [Nematostella vectensis]